MFEIEEVSFGLHLAEEILILGEFRYRPFVLSAIRHDVEMVRGRVEGKGYSNNPA